MATERRGKYRERSGGSVKTKTIGFVPAPDVDEKLRAISDEMGTTIARTVDLLICAGLTAQEETRRENEGMLTDRIEGAVRRLEAVAWTADEEYGAPEKAAAEDRKCEMRLIASLLCGQTVAQTLAIQLGSEAFDDQICHAIAHHLVQRTFTPVKADPSASLDAVLPLVRVSHPEAFSGADKEAQDVVEAQFRESMEPYISDRLSSRDLEAIAARIFVRAARRRRHASA